MTTRSKPTVLLIRLASRPGFYEQYAHLLSALDERCSLVEVRTDAEAITRLSNPQAIAAVVVADGAMAELSHSKTPAALKRYVKDGGGTVVYACDFAAEIHAKDMNTLFLQVWGLNWRADAYRKAKHRLTRLEVLNVSKQELAIENEEDSSVLNYHASVAFSASGKGHVGYVGSLHGTPQTTPVILALCSLREPEFPNAVDDPRWKRSREAEVAARAEKRRAMQKEQNTEGENFKDKASNMTDPSEHTGVGGRNICLAYLLDKCHRPDDFCPYSHEEEYLRLDGWWNDPIEYPRLQRMVESSHDHIPNPFGPKLPPATVSEMCMRAEAKEIEKMGPFFNGTMRDMLGWTYEEYCLRKSGNDPAKGGRQSNPFLAGVMVLEGRRAGA
ncbi:hypothetical protein PUNSTDRAFT_146586 [Punctularia strigosozonata HHB-11173 SS5]|uniref:C3H1-type domain-containing protein n=1 Tax=Punctularia strigosozonata (strain HHB-11173) TaxID=741275 RepID=R7S3D7_PUNST|nr:uncharacterized protein PUNSTDRAFT_146586 [Punctularia strigosozonata HHB-11173 SS5]EIN04379.1 hypothetical protein PUNSTDRAFT_146586 [Punctularia strigosozonata HHB-11173 SS5]